MALSKTINTPYGATADYHNLQSIRWGKNNTVNLHVFSYADQAARLENKEPLLSSHFEFPDVTDIDAGAAYALLKTQSLFDGATDV